MGQLFFETKALLELHHITVFSSNYELYGDISSRLMSVLTQFAPEVEVYSIDEAFLQLSDYWDLYPTYRDLGQAIHTNVRGWLHIPVGVGIAPTKTLAKMANKLAKNRPELGGVCVLDSVETIEQALDTFPVEDLWGVGSKSARKLRAAGIQTAAQLRDVNDDGERATISP